MKAQKKPIVIDYLLYKGVKSEVREWVENLGDSFEDNFINIPMGTLAVKTLEGTSYNLIANTQVIIRGVKGEYYPCEIEIFYNTYDLLDK